MMGYIYVTYLMIQRTGRPKAGSDRLDRRQAATGRQQQGGNNREGGNALADSDTLERREAGSNTRDREELQAGECVWGMVSCD